VKKPQFIAIITAVLLTAGIFLFGRTVPKKPVVRNTETKGDDNHSQDIQTSFTIDSILFLAKKQLSPEQLNRVQQLEQKEKAAPVSGDQKLHLDHELARFWSDSARIFEPYAWYLAEAARLENSEKNLTFAARLFLENMQEDEVIPRKQWKALQAKDLFERSLRINPDNDSARIGLGACYLFGNISATPMEGILKIREVAEKDSTNAYAQMMLARGSLISGQYDKAVSRLQIIIRINPKDLDASLLLAEVYERMNEKQDAINWYRKCLELAKEEELKSAIRSRIDQLKK
jgi:Tfp pilus assembly protein PilF